MDGQPPLGTLEFQATDEDHKFAEEHLPQRLRPKKPRVPAKKARPKRPGATGAPQAAIFYLLNAHGMIRGELEPGKWAVTCPFQHQHTADSESGTVLWDASAPGGRGKLHCSHAHCQGRSQEDFWLAFPQPERDQAEADARKAAFNLPVVALDMREEKVATTVISYLGRLENVFCRGGSLVRVVVDASTVEAAQRGTTTLSISPMTPANLRELITEAVTLVEETTEGVVARRPPNWLVYAILERGQWDGVRPLAGIVRAPVLRPDGTVLEQPGYDPTTHLLYAPERSFTPIPQAPTQADAVAACQVLLELVVDFPFASPEALAGWAGIPLTLLAQYAYSGPAPAFILDSPTPASGKGLAGKAGAEVGTAETPVPTPEPGSEEEERKRITGVVMAGKRVYMLDNLTHPFGSGAADALLTSTEWQDRRLGSNVIFTGEARLVWLVTGNNVEFRRRDTMRRVVHIRLEPREENPETRQGFRYPDLLGHVRRSLDRYTWAALTMLRAFAVAGFPSVGLQPWGSFEGWSRIVRGCLVWCGLADPAKAREELTRADTRTAAVGRFLACLEQELATSARQAISAADLSRLLEDEVRRAYTGRSQGNLQGMLDALDELGCKRHEIAASKLGTLLGRIKGTVSNGRRLAMSVQRGTNLWGVEVVGGGRGGGGGCAS